MDFGAILDKWEKKTPVNAVYHKDIEESGEKNVLGERRSRLLRKKPDACIDLHGLTSDEAWTALETFFEDSRSKGFEKVLIIHGKGNHISNGNEGALKLLSRRFVEHCSFAGESGQNTARDGGSGATWVILKDGISVRGK